MLSARCCTRLRWLFRFAISDAHTSGVARCQSALESERRALVTEAQVWLIPGLICCQCARGRGCHGGFQGRFAVSDRHLYTVSQQQNRIGECHLWMLIGWFQAC